MTGLATDPEDLFPPVASDVEDGVRQNIHRLQKQVEQQEFAIQKHEAKKASLQVKIDIWRRASSPDNESSLNKKTSLRLHAIEEEIITAVSETLEDTETRASRSTLRDGEATPVAQINHSSSWDTRDPSHVEQNSKSHLGMVELDTEAVRDQDHSRSSLSKRSNMHLDSANPPQRKRRSIFSRSKSPATAIVIHQDADMVYEADIAPRDPIEPPPIYLTSGSGRSRLSQVFHSLHFGSNNRQNPDDFENGLLIVNSAKHNSYPLSRRFRRSLELVSVKHITDRFENMKLGSKSTPKA